MAESSKGGKIRRESTGRLDLAAPVPRPRSSADADDAEEAGVKEVDQDEVLVEAAAPAGQCAQEEEGINKFGFNVGNLSVNGVGALCSFGVAAATFCIFLFGGK